MLTAIGRAAAARRALASAAPSRLALAAAAARSVALPPARGFGALAWLRAPTATAAAASTKKAAAVKPKKAKAAAAAKPKKKAAASKAKKRVVKKKKVAPKPKKKKRVLTPEEKEKANIRELKNMALLKGPKLLPGTAWSLYVAQHTPTGNMGLGEKVRKMSADFDALPASEKERLTATARANQVINAEKRQAWIGSYPYEAIYMANLARRQLARKLKKTRFFRLYDERQPKRASGAYALFVKSRYRGISDLENSRSAFRVLADEWKALSDADKKPFQDMAAAEARKVSGEFEDARVAGNAYWKAQKAPAGGVSSPKA